MIDITNLFSSDTQEKSLTDIFSDYINNNSKQDSINMSVKDTPALTQGEKFLKYQTKIKDIVSNESNQYSDLDIEGFTSESFSTLSSNVDKSINKNFMNVSDTKINNALDVTIKDYKKITDAIEKKTKDYFNRVSTKNPYLGKNIKFSDGTVCYVTNQGVAKPYKGNTFGSISGKNGCPTAVVQVNLKWSSSYTEGATIPTNPPLLVGTPMKTDTSCGNEGRNVYVDSTLYKPSATYDGCYINSGSMKYVGDAPDKTGAAKGKYSYEACQQAAASSGSQFFALQNVSPSTDLGYCSIGNDGRAATKLGKSTILGNKVMLWQSGTGGKPGNIAKITKEGGLVVISSTGTTLFSTPVKNLQPTNLVGCYTNDLKTPAMTAYNNGAQIYNDKQCQTIAEQGKYAYYGLSDPASGAGAKCLLGNDIKSIQNGGVSQSCATLANMTKTGGQDSTAVYRTKDAGYLFLLRLGDDGSMYIQETSKWSIIWNANTAGRLKDSEPNYIAKKGKYGRDYLTSNGDTLASGDWIASNNGKMGLFMQSDGNLVLYAFVMKENCNPMKNSKLGGGVKADALYKMDKVGVPSAVGSVGYVDEDALLYTYPSNNTGLTTKYTTFTGFDSAGNDIKGASKANSSIANCQKDCDANKGCFGFVFDNERKMCYPKGAGVVNNTLINNPKINTYVRNKGPIKLPEGVKDNSVVNIDSLQFSKYSKAGPVKGPYGLLKATGADMKQEKQTSSKLAGIVPQISNETKQFLSSNTTINSDMKSASTGLDIYGGKYKSASDVVDLLDPKKREGFKNSLESELQNLRDMENKIVSLHDNNIDNMLEDSDIVILQQNYHYILWSILAITTTLVAIKVLNK